MTHSTLSNSTDIEDLSGQHIKGYILRTRVGYGGFGAVYRGYQPAIAREVAIKVIQRKYANNPQFIRAFETEAQLIARLEHIHIVPLYDFWREPNRAFLVMRWLGGGSLRTHLSQYGPPDLTLTGLLLDQISSALALAHRQNVIHRDIKPDNILLDEEGNAFLSDFGIASTAFEESSTDKRILGTPAYMAPELIQGEQASPQSDIYSLGVVLFELLTGKNPLTFKTLNQIAQLHATLASPIWAPYARDLPSGLNTVIWRATARKPEARYPDTLVMAAEFRQAAQASAQQYADYSTTQPATVETQDALLQTTIVFENIWQPKNPFKGLRPFEQTDAVDFFGRTALVDQLLTQLCQSGQAGRFLAIVGPSGSGKSSVVKAGLIPALRAGQLENSAHWFFAEMVPGKYPFKELEAALLSVAVGSAERLSSQLNADDVDLNTVLENILPDDAQTTLLLVIDQFEEVFTQVEDETQRKRFLRCISSAVASPNTRLRIVITLRADFYDRPLLYEDFGTLLRETTEVVLPLTTQELKAAISKPAERINMMVEPELVSTIIADVNEQPGALPLMQYALTEAFEHRDGRRLTLDSYIRGGGVTGALARRAEGLYNSLPQDHQEIARQLFMQLVNFDEENEVTRRRVNWSTMLALNEDSQAAQTICELLIKYRLLTTDHDPASREPTIEVAHEALLREWHRLTGWLDSSQVDIQMQRRMHTMLEEWLTEDKDTDFLLTGSRLAQYEEWASSSNMRLTLGEQEYLQASITHHQAIQAEEETRQRREKRLEIRTRNRLWIMVSVLVVAVLIMSGFAWFAIEQRTEAEEQQIEAERRLREVQYLSVTDHMISALEDNNPELALALGLALDFYHPDVPALTRQVLYRAAYTPGSRLLFDAHQAPIIGIAVSPDGVLAATSSGRINPLEPMGEHAVRVWNMNTGDELFVLDEGVGGHSDSILGLAFNPDGTLLASGATDGTIIFWDTATGERIRQIKAHDDWVNRLVFTSDGKQLISVSGNFLSTVFPIPTFGVKEVSIRVWDVATGEQIRQFGHEGMEHDAPIMSLALTADDRFLATGDAEGNIVIWDFASGNAIRYFASPGDWVSSLAFSPDGSAVFSALGRPSIAGSGSSSILMVMWDIDTGKRQQEFIGHTNVVISVDVSPDGRTALTGSADYSVRLWDIATGQELQLFSGHNDWVFGVKFTPDGKRALSGSMDNTARVWDLDHGAQVFRFDTGNLPRIRAIDIHHDAHTWLEIAGLENGAVVLWNIATDKEIQWFGTSENSGHSDRVLAVAFSPDGTRAVSASLDHSVIIWDVATGAEIHRLEGHGEVVLSLAYSPDGRYIATGSGDPLGVTPDADNSIRLWDAATGEELARFEGHQEAVWSLDFSSDGRKLVSGSGNLMRLGDNSIRIWDVATSSELMHFDGHENLVKMVAFSPDDKMILSSSNDNTIRLWNVETHSEIQRIEGDTGFFTDVKFDPDGRTILVGLDDGTLGVWDVMTGDELNQIVEHDDTIHSLALTADGRHVLVATDDNQLTLWRIDRNIDELLEWLFANRHLRDLTCLERETYRLEPCDNTRE